MAENTAPFIDIYNYWTRDQTMNRPVHAR